jgi:tol-pal system protein YbgF
LPGGRPTRRRWPTSAGQIATLSQEIGGLRAQLSASGQLSTGVAGNTPLERLNAIEAELQRLTSKTEELEFRINRITTTARTDWATSSSGFAKSRRAATCRSWAIRRPGRRGQRHRGAVPAEPPARGPNLAVNEQADFERAEAALAGGDAAGAAQLFADFVAKYPGSPLTARAQLGRGTALDAAGDVSNAARAYLDSFSADPDGPVAPDALLSLGRNLGRLGQVPDACVTLAEVEARFPASPLVLEAQAERRALGCP